MNELGNTKELKSLSFSRSRLSLCGLPNILVSIGGYDGNDYSKVTEAYFP